jgi:hypothetical protein
MLPLEAAFSSNSAPKPSEKAAPEIQMLPLISENTASELR